MSAFAYDAPDAIRCTCTMGALRCSLARHDGTGHVYVSGSYVPDSPHEDDALAAPVGDWLLV